LGKYQQSEDAAITITRVSAEDVMGPRAMMKKRQKTTTTTTAAAANTKRLNPVPRIPMLQFVKRIHSKKKKEKKFEYQERKRVVKNWPLCTRARSAIRAA